MSTGIAAAPFDGPANSLDNGLASGPADGLAEGLAAHLQAWALQLGASPAQAQAAALAAQQLSTAMAEGHVCLGLAALQATADSPGTASGWRTALLGAGVTGTPAAPGAMPLILDDDDRLYLHRYFDYEQRLARRLIAAAHAPATAVIEPVAAQLRQLFAGNTALAAGQPDWQALGAALALRQRLVVISGGPGTGKTTTVVNLLACLLTQQPDARIALAAPTGKAAARMSEALRGRARHLPEALRSRLPTESFTIHRLLGVTPAAGGFVHHAGHRLALDVLVVDEASMLDLALATKLLEAVPEGARIVLLGDKDQLAAVESGAVFAELSADPRLSPACAQALATLCGLPAGAVQAPAPTQPSALRDTAVWFSQNFRFAADSGIGLLAQDIRQGQAAPALARLRTGADPALQWLDDGGPQPGAATLQALADGHAPYLAAVQQALAQGGTPDVAALMRAFDGFRVLCAVREGPRGQGAVNERLSRLARAGLGAADSAGPASPWYPGRPVMVLRNDPVLRLFNGDIGLTLPDAHGTLMVWFADASAPGGHRPVAPVRLPAHQTAYAMTVHKSQGSEFDAVLLLLPARPGRLLSRELLYTGLTRARQRVALAASAPVLAAAIAQPTQRHSGLLARLAAAATLLSPAADPT